MAKTTRESLFARKAKIKPVTIPDYGEYHLKVLTRTEYDAVSTKVKALKPGDDSALTLGLIAATLTDEDGKILFDFNKVEDIDAVGGLDFPVVTALDKALVQSHFPKPDKVELAIAAKK